MTSTNNFTSFTNLKDFTYEQSSKNNSICLSKLVYIGKNLY